MRILLTLSGLVLLFGFPMLAYALEAKVVFNGGCAIAGSILLSMGIVTSEIVVALDRFVGKLNNHVRGVSKDRE